MFKAKTRKWGSSMGIIIPKQVLDDLSIGVDEEIVVEVKKKNILQEFCGAISSKKSTRQLLDESRKEIDSTSHMGFDT